jgi:hypothetical protein
MKFKDEIFFDKKAASDNRAKRTQKKNFFFLSFGESQVSCIRQLTTLAFDKVQQRYTANGILLTTVFQAKHPETS